MAAFGSAEELINNLKLYNNSDYVEANFISWLYYYPNIIFNIMLDYKYNHLFDKAIRKNMDQILRTIIKSDDFYYIYELELNYSKEIFDNIDIILDEDKYFAEHFCELVSFEGFKQCASDKQEKILQKALEYNNFNDFSNYNNNLLFLMSAMPFFSVELVNKHEEKIKKFLEIHFKNFKPESYGRDSLFLFKTISLCSNKFEFINEFFSNNLHFIAAIFANRGIDALKSEKVLDFYVELIKDVIRIENATIKDMYLKSGDNSRSLIIKDKVLKSGRKWTKQIPYHKRILQPIVRQNINRLDTNVKKDLDFIEVYERVDDLNSNDYDTVYMVFKEMLDDGIIFGDPHIDNLGVLIKDNKAFYETEDVNDDNFYIDNETVNIFDTKAERQILKAGEVVVRDVDCLYYYENIKDFIIFKLRAGEKVTSMTLRELDLGCDRVNFGAAFNYCMERYCLELRDSLNANQESMSRR